jgi:hypothetical protein
MAARPGSFVESTFDSHPAHCIVECPVARWSRVSYLAATIPCHARPFVDLSR